MTGSVMMNREVAPGQFLLTFRLPAGFPTPAPGQFVMIKAGDGYDPLLRRPFSVHAFKSGHYYNVLEIMLRIVGGGTRRLASLRPESTVNIVGPLGHGFTIIPQRKNVIIIAGGIGVAPLSFLVQHYFALIRGTETVGDGPLNRIICYVGATRADSLVGLSGMEACCDEVHVSTDDGSNGFHGNVIELFRRNIAFYNPEDTAIYACGPAIMLKELAKIFAGGDFFCQVSMEERMACGLGACLGCAVAGKGRSGHMTYQRVCKDGPVFNIQDLDWQA